jgi:haloalkane dehalogenase
MKRVLNKSQHAIEYLDSGPATESSSLVILALHGNPTAPFLWRGLFYDEQLLQRGRVIVPSLSGSSVELECEWIESLIHELELTHAKIVMVAHDWGSVIALKIWERKKLSIAGLAFGEALLFPLEWKSYDFIPWVLGHLGKLPWIGYFLLVHCNIFVKFLLPLGCIYKMLPEDHQFYLGHYASLKARKRIHHWVQLIPTQPNGQYYKLLLELTPQILKASIPKLYFSARPGLAINELNHQVILSTALELTHVDLGPGIHFLPEDYPLEIAKALTDWSRQIN